MFKRWCERGISLRILHTTYQRLTLESWFTNLQQTPLFTFTFIFADLRLWCY